MPDDSNDMPMNTLYRNLALIQEHQPFECDICAMLTAAEEAQIHLRKNTVLLFVCKTCKAGMEVAKAMGV
jgi:hypothetical protein